MHDILNKSYGNVFLIFVITKKKYSHLAKSKAPFKLEIFWCKSLLLNLIKIL